MRGFYLFMVSTEKDRKMSELKFAIKVWSTHWTSLVFQKRVEKYEVKMKACRARKDQWDQWDSFVFSLSNFYWRLRMVKYQFINTQSLRSVKKPRKYDDLKCFVKVGLIHLQDDCRQEQRVKLPPNTNCGICKTNLGERMAKRCIILPNQIIWPKETNMAFVVLKAFSHYPLTTCGGDSCNKHAENVYKRYLRMEASYFYEFLVDSQICHGCSEYCLKTHRCSRCRLARFCSQDCFNVNWKEHSVRCEPYIRPGNKELFASRKLVGEAKQNYIYEVVNTVNRYYDPYFGIAFDAGYRL